MKSLSFVAGLVAGVLGLAVVPGGIFAAEFEVEIRNNRFIPEVVTLDAGDTVNWTVVEGRHQLTSADSVLAGLTSPDLGPGDSFSFVFDQPPGEYFYSSAAVEGMRAAVQIREADVPFVIDGRISSGWYNPEAAGQGFLFEYVPSTDVVVVYWFTFGFEADRQLWLIGTGTPQGNRVSMEMLEPLGGQLNSPEAVAKDGWGQITVEFTSCNQATAYFDGQKDQKSGRVSLQRLYLTSLCE